MSDSLWPHGLQGFSDHGILQARILEWIDMPSSRRSSQPRDRTHGLLQLLNFRQILYHWSTREVHASYRYVLFIVPPTTFHTVSSVSLPQESVSSKRAWILSVYFDISIASWPFGQDPVSRSQWRYLLWNWGRVQTNKKKTSVPQPGSLKSATHLYSNQIIKVKKNTISFILCL